MKRIMPGETGSPVSRKLPAADSRRQTADGSAESEASGVFLVQAIHTKLVCTRSYCPYPLTPSTGERTKTEQCSLASRRPSEKRFGMSGVHFQDGLGSVTVQPISSPPSTNAPSDSSKGVSMARLAIFVDGGYVAKLGAASAWEIATKFRIGCGERSVVFRLYGVRC